MNWKHRAMPYTYTASDGSRWTIELSPPEWAVDQMPVDFTLHGTDHEGGLASSAKHAEEMIEWGISRGRWEL